MSALTDDKRTQIIDQWIRNQDRRDERKHTYKKPTAEQRKQWNQKYYQSNKVELSTRQADYYQTNKVHARERAKFNYYKKLDRLDELEQRYPEIHNKFMEGF
tara:strand:+ start:5623 stop:5928 length:306 start_codon:yes stop_codon:yes gene_type:complete